MHKPTSPPTPERRLALTGASGILGEFIARKLLADGYGLKVLLRSPKVPPWLRPAVDSGQAEIVTGALEGAATSDRLLQALLHDTCACIHCAFHHLPGRYRTGEGKDPAAFWNLNLLSTLALAEGCLAHGTERLLCFSSRAVFDGYALTGKQPLWLEDHALPKPTTHYGALKAAQESLVMRYGLASRLCCTALRPTGVFGLRDSIEQSKWFALLRQLRQGKLPVPRNATEVHGQDLASAAALLLTAESARISGRIWNCADVLVSHRSIVASFNKYRGTTHPLPEVGPQPLVRQDCSGLQALGWQPGGDARLQQTLQRLLELTA